jgi:type I restriction enzyme, R subunit
VKYDEVFVRHAAFTERHLFDDPNSTLTKLRRLSELLAQHAAAYAGIVVEAPASHRDLIDKLWDHQIINAQVAQLFHGLCKAGNEAAHLPLAIAVGSLSVTNGAETCHPVSYVFRR